ncbi:MAG TPA: transketolase [Aggregatilineales bacterium]|nr:transketolase [Chloroflexota bacterium]HOA23377.1 transketolase [Aggregatilineales bacterium]HPV07196.1 transketolase [Aggregatilineales bacterium]HQA68100.1 transketolase [Aggregatilineales bacterium]
MTISERTQARTDLEAKSINAIRFLAVDAVQKANSGHPGLPMGAAVMAYVLWTRHMRYNPRNPNWFNRDRFILSAGHGSMLLYAMLYLTGYDVTLDDLKQFRQWGSITPGHPENFLTPGVEVTTGPLGQGFANGVGMAIAERFLAEKFNTSDLPLVDHYTYAIVSDGDLMEGVSSEAASYAGTQRLGKLIYLYDSNQISIEGDTQVTFQEDVAERFRAYGWQVIGPIDGMDVDSVDGAINLAKRNLEQPSLIICRTVIGYGSPNMANTGKVHGAPLGEEEVRLTKENLGWPLEPDFYVPDDVLEHYRQAIERGQEWEAEWNDLLERYREQHPEQAAEFERMINGELPENWDAGIPEFKPEDGAIATRSASGKVLNGLFKNLPDLIGGSADLAPSNNTWLKDGKLFGWEHGGHNLQFGVREHAMGSMSLGMAHHGGVIPYCATFLVFSDYMRPPVRLSALSRQRVIFVYTHDSIALGEDGPTHQPVEHLIGLRAIPRLRVIRPADANEVAEAWRQAILHKDGPTAIVLTRQNLPIIDRSKYAAASGLAQGAYILREAEGEPDIVIIATGSEVHLALGAAEQLAGEGVQAQVVSMPCWELFDEQPESYRQQVIPRNVPRLAVEAGSPLGWHKYVGEDGAIIGIDRFGASAPGSRLMKEYGFTVENVVEHAKALLNGRNS